MITYVLMDLLKRLYGVDTYITEEVYRQLSFYFKNINIPVAERQLCGFKDFFTEFTQKREEVEQETILREKERRMEEGWRKEDAEAALHSYAVRNLKHKITQQNKRLSNFPWETFQEELNKLGAVDKNVGKSYIFYPAGFPMNRIKEIFDRNYPMDAVPGLVQSTVNSFTLRERFRRRSQHYLHKFKSKYIKRKKLNKNANITFIGIHSRQTDHLAYQRERGLVQLKASYYLEAMEIYRNIHTNVVFVFISDNPGWGREVLLQRTNAKDLFIAKDEHIELAMDKVEEVGLDLALLTACNHTILSYGTFGFWAGFLAGGGSGMRVIPPYFERYRGAVQRLLNISRADSRNLFGAS